MTAYKVGQKVLAPLGVAYISARTPDGYWLVMYSRRDYTPEGWVLITKYNGPCVYREYLGSELTEVSDDLR